MIVPVPAGGSADLVGRVLAERMRGPLRQQVVIENVSGAGGSIGVGRTARARPDGYTIDLGATSTHALNGAFYPLPYDLLSDFTPIVPLVTNPIVLFSRKTMQAEGLNELVGWLKANPNKVSVGVPTVTFRLLTAFFEKQLATQFVIIPYRGAAPAMQDLIAGQIDLLFSTPDGLPLAHAGSIKAYAVTSDTRLAVAPDFPTFGEMGLPALGFSAWYGLFAPRGTPREIVAKLNAAAVEALGDPAVQSQLTDIGAEVFPRGRQTPEVLRALVKADVDKWWPIIRELGIKAE
jgi:tripartite-type tricarboxylate transporter receptor subunit TctC